MSEPCPCPSVKSEVKSWWNAHGGLMVAGALCFALGMIVTSWMTSDVRITITATPKSGGCCPAPMDPKPAPPAPKPCPCKPKPGGTGEIEAGPCECPPGDCHCPPVKTDGIIPTPEAGCPGLSKEYPCKPLKPGQKCDCGLSKCKCC
jgi:hypothetical protein